jgi:hypothetical protein
VTRKGVLARGDGLRAGRSENVVQRLAVDSIFLESSLALRRVMPRVRLRARWP